MLRTCVKIWKFKFSIANLRAFHSSTVYNKKYCCKLLIVGGGHAGTSMAHKFSKILNQKSIIVIEPSEVHYYQPAFTLVASGLKRLRDCARTTIGTLPKDVVWIKDEAVAICPLSDRVVTKNNDEVSYEYMIIAVGVAMDYERIEGLVDALEDYPNIATIFSTKYVEKTFECMKNFKGGTALFTAPQTPTKCLSASFKICFMGEDYFKRRCKLDKVDVVYATAQKKIFPVPIYERTILDVANRRKIDLQFRTTLIKVIPERNEAIFQRENGTIKKIIYDFLHVTPPMYPPVVLCECKELISKYNYVDVDMNTLQHKKYPNVFALGDCTPGVSNKTSSAVGVQSGIVYDNLKAVMQGHQLPAFYDGYTACPILTCYGKCIMAEFNYKNERSESLPCDQNKESHLMYFATNHILPSIYWRLSVKGRWNVKQSFLRTFRRTNK